MKIHINVTQEDIEQGCKADMHGCMVHRAFLRATEGAYEPLEIDVTGVCDETGPWISHSPSDNDAPVWTTQAPRWVGELIERWDLSLPIDPFSFDLDIPEEAFIGALV